MSVLREVDLLIASFIGGAEDPAPKPKAQLCDVDGGYCVRILDAQGEPLFTTVSCETPELAVENARRLRQILSHLPLRKLLAKDEAPIPFDRASRRDDSPPPPMREPA